MPDQPVVLDSSRPAVSPGPERRSEPRLPCPEGVTLLISGPRIPDGTRVAVQDVSRRGVGFFAPVELDRGQHVQLVWEFGPQGERRTLAAAVAHVMMMRPGLWRAGCLFDTSLSLDELGGILSWGKES